MENVYVPGTHASRASVKGHKQFKNKKCTGHTRIVKGQKTFKIKINNLPGTPSSRAWGLGVRGQGLGARI